jgi:hypothetical protein
LIREKQYNPISNANPTITPLLIMNSMIMENSYHCLNYNPSLGKPKDVEVETSKNFNSL